MQLFFDTWVMSLMESRNQDITAVMKTLRKERVPVICMAWNRSHRFLYMRFIVKWIYIPEIILFETIECKSLKWTWYQSIQSLWFTNEERDHLPKVTQLARIRIVKLVFWYPVQPFWARPVFYICCRYIWEFSHFYSQMHICISKILLLLW